jgi:RHS repeat-associated protein
MLAADHIYAYQKAETLLELEEKDASATHSLTNAMQPHRLFVWGLEDFSELAAMIYPPNAGQSGPDYVSYTLQDAGGNVVAEVDGFGYGPLFQFRYAPYGEYQAYENAENGADLDVQTTTEALWQPFGFQGGWYDQETGLICFGHRCYDPRTGRWLQADPYGSGLVYVSGLWHHGQVGSAEPFTETQNPDGPNPYEAWRSNPIINSDPSGLSVADFDWSYETEDMEADLIGHRLYALGTLNEGARWASLGLQTAADIAVSLIPGYGIYEAYKSVEIISSGRGGLMDYLSAGFSAVTGAGTIIKAGRALTAAAVWTARGKQGARTVRWLKPFTADNWRHNLKVWTGLDPPDSVHAHHVFPRQFETQFSAVGINIHDPRFGAWWAGSEHLAGHAGGYNEHWREFFERNPTAQKAVNLGRRLAREYGFNVGF